jgi:hypothetical protein
MVLSVRAGEGGGGDGCRLRLVSKAPGILAPRSRSAPPTRACVCVTYAGVWAYLCGILVRNAYVCGYVPHMYAGMYRICRRVCTAYVCGYVPHMYAGILLCDTHASARISLHHLAPDKDEDSLLSMLGLVLYV